MESLDADQLRAEARKGKLSAMLGGVALSKQATKGALRAELGIHAHAWAVHDALARDLKVQGDMTMQSDQTSLELRRLCTQQDSSQLLLCSKRALLLLALHLDPATRQHWQTGPEAALVRDLVERVLPLAAPSYVASGGSAAEEFCVDCQALLTMWEGERFYKAPAPSS